MPLAPTGCLRGEVQCIHRFGDVALQRGDQKVAQEHFEQALTLYQSLSDVYSIGLVHRQLARLAFDPEEKRFHALEANAAWKQMKLDDLVELKSEFEDVL